MNSRASRLAVVLALGVPLALILIPTLRSDGDQRELVVYCSQDAVFAKDLIAEFERRSGLTVTVRYDEEANKSLGLTQLLIAEQQNPRCDVYWNNQTLGTTRLQDEGVLDRCLTPNRERIPEAYRDEDGYWTGFAARLRVWIINTDLMEATPEAIQAALQADDLSSMAIAEPRFGTTLSHYTHFCALHGMADLQGWHSSLMSRGVRQVRGNSVVRDLVADGICAFGLTDTDDAFGALDQGKPVAILPVEVAGRTLMIPNSVALIRGAPHPEAAKVFIDFLLSEEAELLMSRSKSRQLPLGDVDESELPTEVRELLPLVDEGADLSQAARYSQSVLAWLSDEASTR